MTIEIDTDTAHNVALKTLEELLHTKYSELIGVLQGEEITAIYSFDPTEEILCIVKNIKSYEEVISEFDYNYVSKLNSILKTYDAEIYSINQDTLQQEMNHWMIKAINLEEELKELKDKLKGLL